MSDLTGAAGATGPMGSPSGAAGGTPPEPDLPEHQGLGQGVDDPDDPTATAPDQGSPLSDLSEGEGTTGSDPMPDMGGTSGG